MSRWYGTTVDCDVDKKYIINNKNFGKGKIIKGPAGFEFMTYQNRLVANAQTACTMLLGKDFQGKQLYKMILCFIVYFDRIIEVHHNM